MSDNNKSFRVKANINQDEVLNVNINQDYSTLEVLSLKVDTENLYKYHTSDYGCVAGRVLANGGFGIPNAKISIFIAVTDEDLEDNIISYLYPYKNVLTKNEDKIIYNLLPEDQLSDCHRNVGTFPSKRTVLDDNNILEVYDKYYKFTTRSNGAGDYMIFGVPVGTQILHVDIDLSDIGILSQKPRDMIYKGYNATLFENASMFKKSNTIETLAQIIRQNQTVEVYPFWGEESEGTVAITRCDIDISYEFTPTCIFIGSLITDEKSNGMSRRCIPSERMGKMDTLTTGQGTIEMIRKKQNGDVESFIVQGNQLIDGNGVWCYQIPLNLDYVRTDEYGNTVPTDDPTKGIPTRARVRFRFSLTEMENDNDYSHLSKVLVPNNPKYYSKEDREKAKDYSEPILDYSFGSETDENSFKDLFWNNVYTVKSHIPRIQFLNIDRNKRFSGIKAVNVSNGNNQIPYNNMRVDLTFMFVLQCAVFKVLLKVIGTINALSSALMKWTFNSLIRKKNLADDMIGFGSRCAYIGEGYCPQLEGWYFAPKCNNSRLLESTYKFIRSGGDVEDTQSVDYNNRDGADGSNKQCVTNNIEYFIQCVETNFALMYDVIQFDFYNDWINGMIYLPRWFGTMRRKRTYLFGLVSVPSKVNACMDNMNLWFSRRYTQQCALEYALPDGGSRNYTDVVTPLGCKNNSKQKCHKAKGRRFIKIMDNTKNSGGVVHDEITFDNKSVYYFKPCEWVDNRNNFGTKCNLFATDIVLLGSIEENNTQGIPQSFKKLTSTSFQMPDPLASTNLGVEGYVYGINGGTICSGAKDGLKIEKSNNSFKTITSWTEGKDYYESDAFDDKEYPITESSGIDWGYSGPNQGENKLSKLYFPGGHFLGVSCFNSQVNIKSCVNLSRICEAGTMPSQRQAIIDKNENDPYSYKYSYIIPTGLISGDDINDYGFKNEFATLNYNGLKTKRNEKTAMLEYDFETIYPINFNGELSEYTDGEPYNISNAIKDNGVDLTTKAYVRTIEENSDDYYRFRLGLHGDYTSTDAKNKYLYVKGRVVSLPVYENSFYFYFGLKNGNTAIDRFFTEFFAECPTFKDYLPIINIDVTPSSFCDNDGEATILVKNIDDPSYRLLVDGEPLTGMIPFGSDTITLQELDGRTKYTLEVYGTNLAKIEKIIETGYEKPSILTEITYSATNYTQELDDLEFKGDGIGTIKLDFNAFSSDTALTAIVIVTTEIEGSDLKPMATIIINSNASNNGASILSEYSSESMTGRTSDITGTFIVGNTEESYEVEEGKIHCWGGNVAYEIVAYYDCGEALVKEHIADVDITMPAELDIVFDDYRYSSYRYLVKPLITSPTYSGNLRFISRNWFDIILAPDSVTNGREMYNYISGTTKVFRNNEERFEAAKYHLKKALFYQSSQCSISRRGGILAEVLYGTPPYVVNLMGDGERVIETSLEPRLSLKTFEAASNNEEMAQSEGYDLSYQSFISPTLDEPDFRSPSYFYDYERDKNKSNYRITVTDAAGGNIPEIMLPSIYRPFFFNAVLVYKNAQEMHVSIGVANGINAKDKTFDIEVNGVHPFSASGPSYTPSADYNGRVADGILEPSFATYYYNGDIPSRLEEGHFEVSVTEGGENGESITLTETANVSFIGDSTDGFYYDPNVTYVSIKAKDLEGFINAKAVNWTGNTPYIEYKSVKRKIANNNNGYAWNPSLTAYLTEIVDASAIPPQVLSDFIIDPIKNAPRLLLYIASADYIVGFYDMQYNSSAAAGIYASFVAAAEDKRESKRQRAFDALEASQKYPMQERHINDIVIVRVYALEDFTKYLNDMANSMNDGE